MSLKTAARRTAVIGVAALLLAAPAASHADAPPAPENNAGILALLDAGGEVLASGSTTAQPGFTSALAPTACPVDFAEAARVSVVPVGGKPVVISATVPLADPAVAAKVPVPAVLADYALGSGATVMLECLSVHGGIPLPAAAVFSVGLDISGSGYTVVPAPLLPTVPPSAAAPSTSAPTEPGSVPPAGPSGSTSDSAQFGTSSAGTTGHSETAVAGTGSGELASTGARLLPLLFGAGLLGAGGAGMLLWKRSRAVHH